MYYRRLMTADDVVGDDGDGVTAPSNDGADGEDGVTDVTESATATEAGPTMADKIWEKLLEALGKLPSKIRDRPALWLFMTS